MLYKTALLGAVAMGTSLVAVAQETPQEDTRLDTIIVDGSRLDQTLTEIGSSVSVITREDMDPWRQPPAGRFCTTCVFLASQPPEWWMQFITTIWPHRGTVRTARPKGSGVVTKERHQCAFCKES